MKKKEYASYFLIAISLFSLLNLPSSVSSRLRNSCLYATDLFAFGRTSDQEMELLQLKVENHALKDQISQIRQWITDHDRIDEYLEKVEQYSLDSNYPSFYKRRLTDFLYLLHEEIHSIDAKVIFRDPALWSSGIWVDKGERDNRRMGRVVIAKNSPVVSGISLVGIVEEVGEDRSFVRLITDASLTPAVRAVRGGEANSELIEKIEFLQDQLKLRDDIRITKTLSNEIESLKAKLKEESSTSYLAKGELRGSSYPLWRSRADTLKGVGFNYDYADREGPARELHRKGDQPLLKIGDLLITTGLDGLFPAGLHVATVSKISPLKEGGYSYDLEAKSTLSDMNSLSSVQICPPI